MFFHGHLYRDMGADGLFRERLSFSPFGDLDVDANQVWGDMFWTPPVSNVGFETYETYLATVAAGSGGVLADSAAVRMNVSAASSDTDYAGKSHIVICTDSALAARTTPAVLAAVFGRRPGL